MDQHAIIVTGAAGFLGSAVTVALARRHQVVAIDRRPPAEALLQAAPGVAWHQRDIADARDLAAAFSSTRQRLGRLDFVVHFAAFYHFGAGWRPEYQRTNVEGTAHVLEAALQAGARRLIFASSMLAMPPPPPGEALSEKSPAEGCMPYGISKCIGERMIRESSPRLPAIVLRIGGVFSDWCELPPLWSLIKLWSGGSLMSRIVVGRGDTGIPYVHRDDFTRCVQCCLRRHRQFGRHEVFLVSQHGAILHKELFPLIRSLSAGGAGAAPIHVRPALAKIGLRLRLATGFALGNVPWERPWMLQYVDRPWVADTSYTRDALRWECRSDLGLRQRLPRMLERFLTDGPAWERRNELRNAGQYAYAPDEV